MITSSPQFYICILLIRTFYVIDVHVTGRNPFGNIVAHKIMKFMQVPPCLLNM